MSPRASTGPVTVPVILTGLVVPLIVSSPSMSSLSPSTRIAVDANESCGLRSASKKSGESRWPLRFGSETPIEPTSTVPCRPVSSSVTENVSKPPRKFATTMCLTEKPTVE